MVLDIDLALEQHVFLVVYGEQGRGTAAAAEHVDQRRRVGLHVRDLGVGDEHGRRRTQQPDQPALPNLERQNLVGSDDTSGRRGGCCGYGQVSRTNQHSHRARLEQPSGPSGSRSLVHRGSPPWCVARIWTSWPRTTAMVVRARFAPPGTGLTSMSQVARMDGALASAVSRVARLRRLLIFYGYP